MAFRIEILVILFCFFYDDEILASEMMMTCELFCRGRKLSEQARSQGQGQSHGNASTSWLPAATGWHHRWRVATHVKRSGVPPGPAPPAIVYFPPPGSCDCATPLQACMPACLPIGFKLPLRCPSGCCIGRRLAVLGSLESSSSEVTHQHAVRTLATAPASIFKLTLLP